MAVGFPKHQFIESGYLPGLVGRCFRSLQFWGYLKLGISQVPGSVELLLMLWHAEVHNMHQDAAARLGAYLDPPSM